MKAQEEFYDCYQEAIMIRTNEDELKTRKKQLIECRKAIDKTLRIINLSLAIKGEKDVCKQKKA